MDIKLLQDTPPWEWPTDAGKMFRKILTDPRADQSERLIAAELAGDYTVINDELANVLLAVVTNANEPEKLRAKAAISFGAALETADEGFDDPDDVPISEKTYLKIKQTLQDFYTDTATPKLLRRRVLEAAVRAPEDWHPEAVRQAYASGDREWVLTAVFAMRWVAGFEDQILEALRNTDSDIHYEAVIAAGEWEIDLAWPHVTALLQDRRTPKDLLMAAIGAVGNIRPKEAGPILVDLTDSRDEDIAEAANEAMMMAETMSSVEDDEDEGEDDPDLIN